MGSSPTGSIAFPLADACDRFGLQDRSFQKAWPTFMASPTIKTKSFLQLERLFFSVLLFFASLTLMQAGIMMLCSALVQLLRTLGSHPSDPGSSPGDEVLSIILCSFGVVIHIALYRFSASICTWPLGLMDKVSASGAGDSRFESWAGRLFALPAFFRYACGIF